MHITLIDEKTSLPLSVRGAYIATTAPYLNRWCLQYFPLIQRRQRRQRNRHKYIGKLLNSHLAIFFNSELRPNNLVDRNKNLTMNTKWLETEISRKS